MFCASGVTVLQNLRSAHADRSSFISRGELMMVLQVLIPTTIFVVLSIYAGIYIPMALFIGFFMIWHGHYSLIRTLPLAIGVPFALFVVFEIWFLVPLPKGPFEHWLGY
jgi:putative tricarboxylic transport membrane protein